jgi:histidinol-phosphate phosphatase family protein
MNVARVRIVAAMSSSSTRSAAFLDRDGTIIQQVELMCQVRQLRLLPGAANAIRLFNEKKIPVLIVTNQPVVARGICTEHDLELIHDELKRRLLSKGAHIDAIYYCPHHPNATLEKYRLKCACRKPGKGMILRAAREQSVDLSRSVMIGDSTQDIMAGTSAGTRTILVRTGHGGRDPWQFECKPDWTARNLLEAARLWMEANNL